MLKLESIKETKKETEEVDELRGYWDRLAQVVDGVDRDIMAVKKEHQALIETVKEMKGNIHELTQNMKASSKV